ncbi:DinB family protein [Emticicia sp. CRIBPO]|uniref:DinB family protein n=1 Tax=Emticicia sp. CRIBPO TaxID=2683258 RepID=UPI001413456A|nr:DinB family protein [Emticicia sp. CRIBPO]NBA84356.1 DinB family protein [Emticicia sp. CRIBPO]
MADKTDNLLVLRIKELLNASFHGGAWHGPSVLEVTKGLKVKEAAFKAGNVHTIAELIYHMTSWRIFVLKRFQGDAEYNIENEKMNWGNFDKIDAFELETLMMEMTLSHDELIKELESKNDDFLNEIVPGSEYNYYTLIHGIIQHDLYHTGQMAILKKLAAKSSGKFDDDDFEGSRYFEDDFDDNLI